MEGDRPSATAEGAAIMRALHQLLPTEARVLDDPIASRLVDPAGAAYQARLVLLAGLSTPVRSRLTNFVAPARPPPLDLNTSNLPRAERPVP
jgi:O-methyltransferase involved in polyketide biosynthesis